jgi:hypothetical protein
LRAHFYFVPEVGVPAYDPDYNIGDRAVVGLLKRIFERGHAIGLHASFDAAWQAGAVARESAVLRSQVAEIVSDQVVCGGRHHYLRWRADSSWAQWELAGLDYDSSLGFPERPGFRCGTCHAFPCWDLIGRRALKLREFPLIAMDSSLYNYMHLGHEAAVSLVSRLADTCRTYGGNLVLLWHNHNFLTPQSKEAYEAVLDNAAVGCSA